MSYYGQGDYYAAGDPGVFSFLGKVAKGALGFVTGGPVGAAAALAPSILRSRSRAPQLQAPRGAPIIGRTPSQAYAREMATQPGFRKKRRRMNYTNTKALKRANRRVDGFVKEVRKTLKHTNYKLVTKSRSSSRGTRGVITKSEAARALRS